MTTRGKLLLVLVAAMLTGTILPAVGAPSVRTAELPYRGPSEIEVGTAAVHLGAITLTDEQLVGPAIFETYAGERFVSLEIVDDSGNPIQGHVDQRFKGGDELLGHFCGSTERPFRIVPRRPVRVYPGSKACDGGVVGATQGTVVARFSK